MFYLGQDSSLNIPRMSFFPQMKFIFSAYQSLKYRRNFYLAGYWLSFVFFSPLIFCRRDNFWFVFACCMLLLLLVLFFNTQNINGALLDNERATAKLLLNRMKSELEKEKWHQLKWQGTGSSCKRSVEFRVSGQKFGSLLLDNEQHQEASVHFWFLLK